ncbi:two-component system, OmpR family, heavy metal sensor histidine kinase CusS [Pseudomonas cuatrocienegasensis]|uniref:Sensor protein n=1 Tax=Pseudomonas cuatrocienegasensis TaxID=543360 RepID=A0ABY1BBG3_9PSED|nr:MULTISPECIES: heavy metal sensor histidine kinase [Pseudomonas]OEC33215.1 two-component sensor histidine kinase [Pseudomonas sp. 21C1]SEQ45064.1 two-component system, OmpR family, heavy metal sensor histidine kinase CusS [Pseudomonas cuatrocienegasensis]
MKPFSLALRLALNVILAGATLVTLLIAMCYWVLERELDSGARNEVIAKLAQIESGLKDDVDIHQRRPWQHVVADAVTGHSDLSLVAIDSQTGAVVLRVGSLDTVPQRRSPRANDILFSEWEGADGTHFLTAQMPVEVTGMAPMLLQLSQNRSADKHLLAAFLKSATAAVPFLLILIGLAGWLVAHQGLRPLRRFRALAAKISARDLSPRIRTDRLPKELQDLALGLNLMLHRLDKDVQQLSQFSDDAAHELRAPLNNLLGKAQVMLGRERDREQYRDALESSVEELERLSRIVTDMLFLAQVSHAELDLTLENIALDEEARRVCNFFAVLAEERGIRLVIDGAASVLGDRLMIQRAISNLLSNALRHAAADSTIHLCVTAQTPHEATLAISNKGAGIAAEHLPHLFERFYRVGKRATGSTGLGLAIVRSIMSLHGGTAAASSHAGQTTFTLTFPTQR